MWSIDVTHLNWRWVEGDGVNTDRDWHHECVDWLLRNCETDTVTIETRQSWHPEYSQSHSTESTYVIFDNEEDAALFKLRWDGYSPSK